MRHLLSSCYSGQSVEPYFQRVELLEDLIEGKGIDGEHFLHLRATQTPPQPKSNCCIQNRLYWDEAILYPAGAHWKDALPSMFWNGLVARIIPSLEKSLSEVH